MLGSVRLGCYYAWRERALVAWMVGSLHNRWANSNECAGVFLMVKCNDGGPYVGRRAVLPGEIVGVP